MPYITEEERNKFGTALVEIAEKPGQLNYQITELMISTLEKWGVSYTNMNNIIGALECAKLEFYRRCAAPYEDKKIKENGDVYP